MFGFLYVVIMAALLAVDRCKGCLVKSVSAPGAVNVIFGERSVYRVCAYDAGGSASFGSGSVIYGQVQHFWPVNKTGSTLPGM